VAFRKGKGKEKVHSHLFEKREEERNILNFCIKRGERSTPYAEEENSQKEKTSQEDALLFTKGKKRSLTCYADGEERRSPGKRKEETDSRLTFYIPSSGKKKGKSSPTSNVPERKERNKKGEPKKKKKKKKIVGWTAVLFPTPLNRGGGKKERERLRPINEKKGRARSFITKKKKKKANKVIYQGATKRCRWPSFIRSQRAKGKKGKGEHAS